MAWLTDDGHRIEVVTPAPDGSYRDHRLRVTRDGVEIGRFTAVGDLRGVVDLRGLRVADATDPATADGKRGRGG